MKNRYKNKIQLANVGRLILCAQGNYYLTIKINQAIKQFFTTEDPTKEKP